MTGHHVIRHPDGTIQVCGDPANPDDYRHLAYGHEAARRREIDALFGPVVRRIMAPHVKRQTLRAMLAGTVAHRTIGATLRAWEITAHGA